MPHQHTVEPGDTLFSIAAAHGFSRPEPILTCDANRALFAARANPYQLRPGEVLTIPDKTPAVLMCEPNRWNAFQLKPPPTALVRLCFRDDTGLPLGGRRYTLAVEGETIEGITGPDGVLQAEVDPISTTGTLTLWAEDGEDPTEFELDLSGLQPVEEVAGAQARLRALGYDLGDEDGAVGELTTTALLAFQERIGHHNPSGALDVPTQQALVHLHDAP